MICIYTGDYYNPNSLQILKGTDHKEIKNCKLIYQIHASGRVKKKLLVSVQNIKGPFHGRFFSFINTSSQSCHIFWRWWLLIVLDRSVHIVERRAQNKDPD